MVEDAWEPLVDRFVGGHYASARGRVRTYVIDQHLRWHLPAPPSNVVDVGGGAGNQSIPLARDGYRITLVDPSAAMLDRARSRLAAEPAEVAERFELVQATGEEAPEALGGRRFAGVLCHGALMYVDDPGPFVRALAELADTDSLVSIVAKNVHAMAVRPALAGEWREALASFDVTHQVNGLGLDSRGDSADELTRTLIDHGVQTLAVYGVRLFTDGWIKADAADLTDDVLAVELEASRRDPYRHLSRLFHLVGIRRFGR